MSSLNFGSLTLTKLRLSVFKTMHDFKYVSLIFPDPPNF